MGTRCLTVLQDNDGVEIAVLYRQFDGYPEGHGQELAEYLAGHAIVNGITSDDNNDNAFNGMADLAARLIAHFSGNGIGGFYLHSAGTRDCGENYTYIVSGSTGEPIIIEIVGEDFKGTPEELIKFNA